MSRVKPGADLVYGSRDLQTGTGSGVTKSMIGGGVETFDEVCRLGRGDMNELNFQ